MKTKIIVVLGEDCSEERDLCSAFVNSFKKMESGIISFCLMDLSSETEHEVLNKVLENIRSIGDTKYSQMIVFYAGVNTTILNYNLPCDFLNMSELFQVLKTVCMGYNTPQQKNAVSNLFTGGLLGISGPLARNYYFSRKRYNTYAKIQNSSGLGGNSYAEDEVFNLLSEVNSDCDDSDITDTCLIDTDTNKIQVTKGSINAFTDVLARIPNWKEADIIAEIRSY